ncbi:RNA polymerase sigma factor [Acutalibacter muris]|uniref:RNA polymerase sigma factor n=1 Tax=Acutalibacter muris TaxID=1796620 RepID=UPI0026F39354|nr:sigma factor [Acutalibacter muris]
MRIIDLYNSRDERAIAETRRKYGPYCNKIALNLLGSPEEAEECVSDTLFAAWRQIPPLIPRSLRAFLGRVTRNLSVSRYRSLKAKRRCPGMEELLSELSDCACRTAIPWTPRWIPGPLPALSPGGWTSFRPGTGSCLCGATGSATAFRTWPPV